MGCLLFSLSSSLHILRVCVSLRTEWMRTPFRLFFSFARLVRLRLRSALERWWTPSDRLSGATYAQSISSQEIIELSLWNTFRCLCDPLFILLSRVLWIASDLLWCMMSYFHVVISLHLFSRCLIVSQSTFDPICVSVERVKIKITPLRFGLFLRAIPSLGTRWFYFPSQSIDTNRDNDYTWQNSENQIIHRQSRSRDTNR